MAIFNNYVKLPEGTSIGPQLCFFHFYGYRMYRPPIHMAVCQNLVPLVNIKIACKWMFIPLKMVLIGINPYPYHIYPHLNYSYIISHQYYAWANSPHLHGTCPCHEPRALTDSRRKGWLGQSHPGGTARHGSCHPGGSWWSCGSFSNGDHKGVDLRGFHGNIVWDIWYIL